MRDETFDYIRTAIANLEEALEDETMSNVEESEIDKIIIMLENLID